MTVKRRIVPTFIGPCLPRAYPTGHVVVRYFDRSVQAALRTGVTNMMREVAAAARARSRASVDGMFVKLVLDSTQH